MKLVTFSACRRTLISANICKNALLITAEVDSIQLPSKPSGLQNSANPIKTAMYSVVIVRKWAYLSQHMYISQERKNKLQDRPLHVNHLTFYGACLLIPDYDGFYMQH